MFFVLGLLTSCNGQSTAVTPHITPTRASSTTAPSTKTPQTPVPTPTPAPAPAHYTSHVVLRGVGRPDDLAFDAQGRLLFSDEISGTINRLNADGTVTRILNDRAGPEGLVPQTDGTLIFAEQETNRIMSLAPGSQTPAVLRTLPGVSGTLTCKHGVDSITLDATTYTLIVPDSPTGEVYRMSLDGKTLTLLASGIARPVGADVDPAGNIYVADECGGAFWRITPTGNATRMGGFGMPDDVVYDGHGNLLLVDLAPAIHALIRVNLTTMQHETLASQGFIEPQGLLLDTQGHIFVSDDYANIIVEYSPA